MLLLKCIKHFLVWLLLITPLQLLGAVLLLIYLPIHLALINHNLRSSIKLPYFLRWFDNADQYVGRDTSTYIRVFNSGYYNLYTWLAWRNPLNYFGYTKLGVINTTNNTLPDDNIGDATGLQEGTRNITVTIDGKEYFEYYYIKKYGTNKCVRIRMGWKLAGTEPGQISQWVFVISPYHSYKGV